MLLSFGKKLGWSFSQTDYYVQRLGMSMFLTRQSKRDVKKQKLKYEKRLETLDPNHSNDLPINQYANLNANPMSKVFLWGQACYGALGNPNFIAPKVENKKPLRTVHTPSRCTNVELMKVRDVACGYGFTVFAVNEKNGHLMGTGINKDGQIGYHSQGNREPFEVLVRPAFIKLPIDDPNDKVIAVACGRSHTLALTKSGDVFSMGNNSYGQCGRKTLENEDYFRGMVINKIRMKGKPEEDKVTAVVCGMDHSIFQTEAGALYSCGWGADGQTGLGHYDNQADPARIGGDVKSEKIVKVSCASDCVLALNDRGEVFGWGNSEYDQFRSVTDEQQINTPVKLNLNDLGRIIDVAAGGTICLVLNENHDVFVWGYGILGKGPKVVQSVQPQLIPSTLFGRNEFSPKSVVTSIACGLSSNAAINSDGDLYTWGKNRSACLGLGDWKDQFFPLKVHLGAYVKKVSLGVEHSGALCKPWV